MRLSTSFLAGFLLCTATGAQAELHRGICEFWEPQGYASHECEIITDRAENMTILNAPERIVGFQGDMLREEAVFHEGYRFVAYPGREFGYCFREEASGVSVCVTPYQ